VIITVVRSGGFAGLVTERTLDTAGAADREAVEERVRRIDLAGVPANQPQPDRYVYRIQVGGEQETRVAEQDLSGDLAWLVDRVLAES
jgi:hypothetical protein